MNGMVQLLIIGIIVCVLLFVGGSALFMLDQTDIIDTIVAEAQTAQAEAQAIQAQADADKTAAQADRIWAAADLAKAEADVERAKGEAKANIIQAQAESGLYEAAASSVKKDSRLVAWYAVRSDIIATILIIASIPIQFAVGAIAGNELYKRYKYSQRA